MRRESLINIGFCVVFLLLAIFIFGYLKSTKAKLKKEVEEVQTSVLRTFLAERGDFAAQFRTYGTVKAPVESCQSFQHSLLVEKSLLMSPY